MYHRQLAAWPRRCQAIESASPVSRARCRVARFRGAGLATGAGNRKPAVAAELGVSLKTLYNKLNAAEERRQAG